MWRRRLTVIAIDILLFVVLAEVVALVLHYFDTGWLFYARRPTYPLIEEAAQGSLTADALHPYFGPIHRPGSARRRTTWPLGRDRENCIHPIFAAKIDASIDRRDRALRVLTQ